MDELLEQFLIEAPELVQQVSEDLSALVDDPGNTVRIDSLFRAVHTLKSSVALFDFRSMGETLHAAEDVLSFVRAERLSTKVISGTLLDCVGAWDRWIRAIAETGALPEDTNARASELIARLAAIVSTHAPEKSASVKADTTEISSAALMSGNGVDHNSSRTLRVDAERIDALVNLVGEMVVAKNGLAHLIGQASATAPQLARSLAAKQAEIDRIVGSMHRSVMNVRMVPLRRTFRRFPRLIRDLALKLNKEINLEIRGEDLEADKAIVDGIFDPLLHLLRNAVDHGIEDADRRQALGKPEVGQVRLEAQRRGDLIVITVSDDGGGLDLAKIGRSAVAAGVATSAVVNEIDESVAADLIFAPGFSTASSVTEVSGRGVGLDAARAAIEALGGKIGIRNAATGGAIGCITLPQSVFITPMMTVSVEEEQFGVPLDAIVETVRLPAEQIKPIRGGAAFVLRDRAIPFVSLCELLNLPETRRPAGEVKILITTVGDELVGVGVSSFAERVDVLLRPMSGLLAGMPGILGSALLGDGRVLLVLDLPELIL